MSSALGRSVSIHQGTFSAGLTLWYVGSLVVLGSLLGIFQGLTGKAAADQTGVGVVGLLVGLGVVFVAFARWKQTLEIFEGGFVWKRLVGTHAVTRSQIKLVEFVTHRSRRGTYVEVAIELTSGKNLSIVGIANPGQAVALLASPGSSQSPAAVGWQPPTSTGASNPSGWNPPGGAR